MALGTDVAYVSWFLGHSDVSLTKGVYGRYVPEAGQREAARLGTFLAPTPAPPAEPEDAEPP